MKKQVIADKGGGGYRPLRTSTFDLNLEDQVYKSSSKKLGFQTVQWHLPFLIFLVMPVSLIPGFACFSPSSDYRNQQG